jgi:hypothetical protein
MDFETQVKDTQSQYEGFVDDSMYSNFSLRGKKFYAKKREASANTAAAAEKVASAEKTKVADQLKVEADKKAAEAQKEVDDAQLKLAQKQQEQVAAQEQVKAVEQVEQGQGDNKKKMLIYGGIGLVAIVVIALVLKSRKATT